MKKKLLALFAACSMITAAVAGMVQTAYAGDDVGVSVKVTQGSSANEKVLTFYYEGVDSILSIQGYFDFWDADENDLVELGKVTVDSFEFTVQPQYGEADPEYRSFYATESRKNRTMSSEDHSFATATITVPGDIDVELELVVDSFKDGSEVSHSIDTVSVTIPAATEEPDPVNIEKQNKNKVITGTGEYESQKADIYGVEVTPVDQKAITGARVTFDGQEPQEYKTGTNITGGPIIFAVILVSASGAELPELTDANVTPIFAD